MARLLLLCELFVDTESSGNWRWVLEIINALLFLDSGNLRRHYLRKVLVQKAIRHLLIVKNWLVFSVKLRLRSHLLLWIHLNLLRMFLIRQEKCTIRTQIYRSIWSLKLRCLIHSIALLLLLLLLCKNLRPSQISPTVILMHCISSWVSS